MPRTSFSAASSFSRESPASRSIRETAAPGVDHRQHEVLDGDVLVVELLGDRVGIHEQPGKPRRDRDVLLVGVRPGEPRQRRDRLLGRRLDRLWVGARLLEERRRDPALLRSTATSRCSGEVCVLCSESARE